MKTWLLRKMILFYEEPRGFILNYFGLFVAGFVKATMQKDYDFHQEKARELSILMGRANLLIDLLKRRAGLK